MKAPNEAERCEVCDWPYSQTGCQPGSCSYRPAEGTDEYHRVQERRKKSAAPQARPAPPPPTMECEGCGGIITFEGKQFWPEGWIERGYSIKQEKEGKRVLAQWCPGCNAKGLAQQFTTGPRQPRKTWTRTNVAGEAQGEVAESSRKWKRAEHVAAIAYQVVGALGAPARILDYFSAVADGKPAPNPLPFILEEPRVDAGAHPAPEPDLDKLADDWATSLAGLAVGASFDIRDNQERIDAFKSCTKLALLDMATKARAAHPESRGAGKCATCGSAINKCGHSKWNTYSKRVAGDDTGLSQAVCYECERATHPSSPGAPEEQKK